MPAWIRNTLYTIMLLCCMIIGAGVYLSLNPRDAGDTNTQSLPQSGQVAGAPEMLPEFTLTDVDGETHSISEWSSQPLLLNFWATWCAPCRREIPLLQTLHTQQAATGVQVVGIAIDHQPDVATFIAEYGVSYPNLVGQEDAMKVSDLFGLDGLGLPFSVLAAADGRVLTVHIGELDLDQIATLVAVSQDYATGDLSLVAARDKLGAL